MKNLTWPAVAVIGLILAAIVVMFGMTPDQPTRDRRISFLESLILFVVGGAAAAAIGASVGYRLGLAHRQV